MVDWTMSVNPHWFSTIWGMLYIGGQGLSAFAFGICVLVMLSQTAPLNRVLTHASLPRPRQAAVRVPDAVGVPVVLAVPDHLVGEHARRDPALPRSLGQQLQVPQHLHRRRALHRAVRAAAVARPQAQHRASCASSPPGSCSRASPTTTGTSRPSCTRTGCRSACSTSRCRSRSAASSCRCSCRSSAAVRCCRSTIRLSTRRCITMSTEHVRHEHDLEYGPTPPGAKHEHTDIDVNVGYKFGVVAGGGDADLGRHRLRLVLVLRGPGADGRTRSRRSIRSRSGRSRNRRRRTCRTSRSRTSTCCGRARTRS